MGLFRRNKANDEEKRAINTLPWIAGGPRPSVVTAESAASLIPVFASVRILADNIASLPLEPFRDNKSGMKPTTYVPSLFFNSPSARDNTFQWIHKCVVSLALRGNAYGLIVDRDDNGNPTTIEWLHPDDVEVDETSSVKPKFMYRGIDVSDDMFHIPWIQMPGCVKGLSPVSAFAATMGIGIAATDYGKRWFDNGGAPPSTMKNIERTVTPDEATEIRKRATKAISTGQTLVLGKDWDFSTVPVNPNESQFIETMKLNATQIAAIYGVPPEAVGGETGSSMTYSTVEQNSINLATLTLRPWLVRLETAFTAITPGRQAVRFNVDAMVRTSTLTRYQANAIALQWMSIDEIRAQEKLPPLPNGEGAFKPKAAPTPPPTPTPDGEGGTDGLPNADQ